ncbi:MAG: hypothetical protein BWZ02_03002 [Lentisphaerae bacterium ADurb.BinA184]|nr:MAG: hypothetical protein BWZ02_03002 [Lentisphaerae bacterium ADurb.BinA184]
MSPGRITVQGMMPLIFLPGPASPSTAPARMRSRLAHCDSDRADSSVCGSSRITSDGRTVWPSGRLNFIPRIRPVIPATRMIAPEATLPAMVGSTISVAVQPIWVRSPLCSCPEQRLAMPSSAWIGWQTAGKSSSSRSLDSSSVLMDSSMPRACPSSEPISVTKSRCP